MRGDSSVLLCVVCFVSGLVIRCVVRAQNMFAYKKYDKIIRNI